MQSFFRFKAEKCKSCFLTGYVEQIKAGVVWGAYSSAGISCTGSEIRSSLRQEVIVTDFDNDDTYSTQYREGNTGDSRF